MAWFPRVRRREGEQIGPELDTAPGEVVLRLPLGVDDGNLACWLTFSYSDTDPLLVAVELVSPSGAVAVERSLLRSDLRAGLRRGVSLAGIVIGPEADGCVPLIIREGDAAVAAVVPVSLLEAFLEAADALVPPGWDAETNAVNRALVAMLEGKPASA